MMADKFVVITVSVILAAVVLIISIISSLQCIKQCCNIKLRDIEAQKTIETNKAHLESKKWQPPLPPSPPPPPPKDTSTLPLRGQAANGPLRNGEVTERVAFPPSSVPNPVARRAPTFVNPLPGYITGHDEDLQAVAARRGRRQEHLHSSAPGQELPQRTLPDFDTGFEQYQRRAPMIPSLHRHQPNNNNTSQVVPLTSTRRDLNMTDDLRVRRNSSRDSSRRTAFRLDTPHLEELSHDADLPRENSHSEHDRNIPEEFREIWSDPMATERDDVI